MEELRDYNSLSEGDEYDTLDDLRSQMEYFFMNPIQKWRLKGTKPWKLLVQMIKIILFTSQLVLFGQHMAKFINYKEEMQLTFKQILLRDWDPSADAIPYPGPYVPYAVYTKHDFVQSINYAIRTYSNITNLSVGEYGYPKTGPNSVPPIEFCMTNFSRADFDPSLVKFNLSLITNTTCTLIKNYADAGDEKWLQFDIRTILKEPYHSLLTASLRFPLRAFIMEDAANGYIEISCFDLDIEILYDNRDRVGQIVIGLTTTATRVNCQGQIAQPASMFSQRRILNTFVMLFCLFSFTLCSRSLWRAFKLMNRAQRILKLHGKTLGCGDKMEFIDFWLVIIVVNDILVGYATVIMTFNDQRLLEADIYTLCSLLLGLGNFLSWSGILRYLSFFQQYNLLIITLRKSFVHVTQFMLCTTMIYCGFCFSGWIIFGPYHYKFRELSTTTECLFSLINGDDMFETFALLRSNITPIWWASRIYLYVFVSLFIYVVLSLFIALIMDAYEIIKQYGENGFPKSSLEILYLNGDMSKLKSLSNWPSP